MPRWETVGEVRRSGNRFEWRVEATYFMVQNEDTYIGSPPFQYANTLWYLTKWPYGWVGPSVNNWIGLGLCGTSSQCPVLTVKLGIKKADGSELKSSRGITSPYGSFEEPRYLRPWQFKHRRDEIALNGYITIFCKVRREEEYELVASVRPIEPIPREGERAIENAEETIYHQNETDELLLSDGEEDSDNAESDIMNKETPKSKSFDKLQLDLKYLLLMKDDNDVTIKVQGKEFHAHKNILKVRCPVFHSMFKHKMVEEATGVVEIDDCEPDTFPDFLHYVYTGGVEKLSAENVVSLYTAADKYCMEELKNECVEFLKTSLSADIFCCAMTLSLRYPETELMEQAIDFFCKNVSEIIVTDGWETFLHENTAEGNKLFIKALIPGKKDDLVDAELNNVCD